MVQGVTLLGRWCCVLAVTSPSPGKMASLPTILMACSCLLLRTDRYTYVRKFKGNGVYARSAVLTKERRVTSISSVYTAICWFCLRCSNRIPTALYFIHTAVLMIV
jgi:hypothetical protein